MEGESKGEDSCFDLHMMNIFLFFCVFLVPYHVSDASEGLFSLKKKRSIYK